MGFAGREIQHFPPRFNCSALRKDLGVDGAELVFAESNLLGLIFTALPQQLYVQQYMGILTVELRCHQYIFNNWYSLSFPKVFKKDTEKMMIHRKLHIKKRELPDKPPPPSNPHPHPNMPRLTVLRGLGFVVACEASGAVVTSGPGSSAVTREIWSAL